MRGYGLPRIIDLQYIDIPGVQDYELKSSIGKFCEKGGDFKSYIRDASKRKAIRRRFKRIERMLVKKNISIELGIE